MKNTIYICFPSFEKDSKDFNDQWIRKFSEYLKILLKRLMADPSDVVLCDDFKIDKNQSVISLFEDKEKNPLLVLPVSLEIITNKGFTEVLNRINEKSKKDPEYLISRVYKVLMYPVSQNDQPDFLKKLRDYNLYDDTDTNNLPFAPHQPAWQRLIDLAYDISGSLLPKDTEAAISESTTKESVVFLAETTKDQENIRDNIKRELIQSGYKVLPINPLPASPDLAKDIINKSIEQSELAIHIVGNIYGELMKDSDVSLIEFQLDTVLKNKNASDLAEIIWLPPDLKPESDSFNQYIDRLRKTALSGQSSEVIQAPVEVLKTMVRKRLSGTSQYTKTESNESVITKGKFIYLIHEFDYIQDVKKLTLDFQEGDMQIVDSDRLGSVENPVKWHRENLVACDGVLIYYPEDNAPWINSKLVDIVKAPGYGRTKPFREKIILVRDKFKDSLNNIANVDIVEMKKNYQQNIINTFR
ncbi:MAG: DUF4062 domain-containing protein [Bacteroidales bacterium]|nr:DUF4062 domain-containing protein [Bacteroidales bacterium]